MAVNVFWKPQEKQRQFMARSEDEALYGGAAGGGKSEALVVEALRQIHIPYYRGLILRRTYPMLKELIDKSRKYYPVACKSAKYNKTEHVWLFPSGAKIYFGSMQYEDNKYDYQGNQFDYIAFDELTHFTYSQYEYLLSRNRPSGPGTRVYMRATANPGGLGHAWVKQRFVTASAPGTRITENVEIDTPDGSKVKKKLSRIFIPSTIFDNKILMENDPNYIARLASMPEAEKKALLYGDWNSFDGQVFTEWSNKPEGYDSHKWTHVINPFEIPKTWKIYRGYDFGYSKPFSVGWYAVDHDGVIYRIGEYYGCTGKPNEGIGLDPVSQAAEIRRIEETDPNLKGRNIIGIADPAIFDESRGESIAEMMSKSPNYIYFDKGDNSRIAGKMQYHYRFMFDKDGYARFYIFNTCKHFIRTIPSLVYDEKRVEDINTEMEDHIYDECRYVLMENPVNPLNEVKKAFVGDDPLDLYKNKFDYDRYTFYRI